MGETVNVLIVEDLPSDAELTEREIRRTLGSCEFRRVETREAYLAALDACCPALIVSDFKLPHFDGLSALRLALERCPDVPFIIVTGSMNEDTAVECMKAGAWDYVIKEHVKRLGPAVQNAMERQRVQMERKRAENELRASEARFRDIFERSTIGKAMTGYDGKLLKVNRAFADMLGLSMEDLQQLTMAAITHPDDLPESRECIRSLLAAECTTYRMEKRYKHQDGHWVSADTSATLLRHVPGTPRTLLASIIDISERKRALAALTASEALTRGILENVQDAYVRADRDSRILMVSPSAVSLYGYDSMEEMIGFSTTLLYANEEERLSIVEEIKQHGDVRDRIGKGRKKDGTLFWVSMNARFFEDEQGVAGAECFVRDISERKLAEETLRESKERYEQLVDKTDTGFVVIDDKGIVVKANEPYQRLTGAERIEDVVGHSVTEWTAPDERTNNAQAIALCARQGSIQNFETVYQHKDGTRLDIAIDAGVERTPDGETHIASLCRNITERKRAEAQRKQLEEQLRGAQRMEAIGLLAGGIAHDFNNLLSVILCSTEFAMERVRENDRAREELLEVKKAGERAVALTRQILAFSRKQVMQPAVLNLNQIAAGVEKMLHRILGEDIDYLQVLAPNLGPVRADPGQIEQVMVNLVVNARDAMPDGGKLTIETRNVDLDEEYAARHVSVKPGPYVQFTVSDTGCGMDKKTQARIFEPFFTTKEKGKGTGLGLSTVYGIVKQSGGNIWIYSEPGQGTTFKIYLPRDLSSPMKATSSRLAAIATAPTGTETILVVEDEEAILGIAKRILREAGYTVLTATNPNEALLTCDAHQGKVNLLLTDVVMPQMGGRALAEHVTLDRPEIKVLYMSGYADDAIVHHGTLDPGTNFIAKPFSATDLKKKVRQVLDSEIANPDGEHEQALEVDAKTEEQRLGTALQALPPDVLDRLWEAVVAARYDEIVALIETIRTLNPQLAARLGQKAELFDYDGLRSLLSQ
jgi:PAS domain S-box-containing protein